jgi:hypothetical protein
MARTNDGPIIPGITKRPAVPPSELDTREAAIWRRVTRKLPQDWVTSGALLFTELCRHTRLSEDLMNDIRQARARIDELRAVEQPTSKLLLDATKDFRALLRLHALESQQIGVLSTRLRLTPQSRFQPTTARAKAAEEGLPEPWNDWLDDDGGESRKN